MIHDLSKMVEKFGINGQLFAWQGEHCKKKLIAATLMKQALDNKTLIAGQHIVEWSSGNMAKYVCEEAEKIGSPVTIIGIASLREKIPAWAALIEPSVLRKENSVTLLGKKALDALTKKYAQTIGAFYFNQLGNPEHVRIYENIAKESFAELPNVDMYTEHIGSGATLIGMGKVLKEKCQDIEIIVNPSRTQENEHSIVFKMPFETKNCDEYQLYSVTAGDISYALERDCNIKRYSYSRGNILSALNWLKKNPGKTAFTTIGD